MKQAATQPQRFELNSAAGTGVTTNTSTQKNTAEDFFSRQAKPAGDSERSRGDKNSC